LVVGYFRAPEGGKSDVNWLRFSVLAMTTAVLAVAYYYHRNFQNGFGLVFAGVALMLLALDLRKSK